MGISRRVRFSHPLLPKNLAKPLFMRVCGLVKNFQMHRGNQRGNQNQKKGASDGAYSKDFLAKLYTEIYQNSIK